MNKKFKVGVYTGAQTGTGKNTQLVNGLMGRFDKKNVRLVSAAYAQRDGRGSWEAADTRANIFKSPKMLFLMAFGVLEPLGGLYLVSSAFADLAGSEEEFVEEAKTSFDAGLVQAAPVAERSVAAGGPVELPASGPVESRTWRVTGFARFDG